MKRLFAAVGLLLLIAALCVYTQWAVSRTAADLLTRLSAPAASPCERAAVADAFYRALCEQTDRLLPLLPHRPLDSLRQSAVCLSAVAADEAAFAAAAAQCRFLLEQWRDGTRLSWNNVW